MGVKASGYKQLGYYSESWNGHQGIMTSIDGTFASSGLVITNGAAPLQLAGVALENGCPVRMLEGMAYLYYGTGSVVTPDIRLYFTDRNYGIPAKGSAFRIPSLAPFALLGWVDIAAADWVPLDDDGTTTNGYAFAKVPGGSVFVPREGVAANGGSRSVFVTAVSNQASSSIVIASGAALGLAIPFEQH